MKNAIRIILILFLFQSALSFINSRAEEIAGTPPGEAEKAESKVVESQEAEPKITEQETAKPQLKEAEQAEAAVLTEAISTPEEGLSKKVSLDLRDMDIIDTIKFLAMQGNLNIVTSKNVNGRITLFLNNVSIADVLDVILFTNNLACQRDKDIITIITEDEYKTIYGKPFNDKRQFRTVNLKYADATSVFNALSNIKSDIGTVIADPGTATLILIDVPEKINDMEIVIKEFDLPTVQRVIPTVEEVFELSYAKAKDIEPEISKSLTENIGAVSINETANKIIVRDLPYKIERIRKLIQEFDAKTKQVLLKAKIVEITLSDDYAAGVDWQRVFTGLDDFTLTGSIPFSAPSSTSSYGELSVGTLASDNYDAALKAIHYIGKTSIISSPHIAVTNNEEAKFMVGSREAYVTTSTTTGEVTTTTSEAVEFIDVGVNLYVTPTINKDGFIKMHIKPEVSSVREWLETSGGNKVPIVDTSNVETDVLIKDGKTVIIAGLIKDTTEKGTSKVPLLGDIPLIGWLFKNKSAQIEKKELVFFLTPQIISGEEEILSMEEIAKPRKAAKAEGEAKERKPRKPAKE